MILYDHLIMFDRQTQTIQIIERNSDASICRQNIKETKTGKSRTDQLSHSAFFAKKRDCRVCLMTFKTQKSKKNTSSCVDGKVGVRDCDFDSIAASTFLLLPPNLSSSLQSSMMVEVLPRDENYYFFIIFSSSFKLMKCFCFFCVLLRRVSAFTFASFVLSAFFFELKKTEMV